MNLAKLKRIWKNIFFMKNLSYEVCLVVRYVFLVAVAFSYPFFKKVLILFTYYPIIFLLSLTYPVFTSEYQFVVYDQSFNFIGPCAAGLAYLFLTGLILTTKDISFFKSLKMWLLGALMIFGMNLFRIYLIVSVAVFAGREYYEALHLIFWKVLSIIFVVLVWIFLTRHYKVESIPLYSDFKTLYKKSIFGKKN